MSGPVTAGEVTALESAEAPVVPTAGVEITESAVSQSASFRCGAPCHAGPAE